MSAEPVYRWRRAIPAAARGWSSGKLSVLVAVIGGPIISVEADLDVRKARESAQSQALGFEVGDARQIAGQMGRVFDVERVA